MVEKFLDKDNLNAEVSVVLSYRNAFLLLSVYRKSRDAVKKCTAYLESKQVGGMTLK